VTVILFRFGRRVFEASNTERVLCRRGPQKVIDVFSDTEIDDLMSLPLIDSTLIALLVEGGLRKSEASNFGCAVFGSTIRRPSLFSPARAERIGSSQ
jgi:hypothetical protein